MPGDDRRARLTALFEAAARGEREVAEDHAIALLDIPPVDTGVMEAVLAALADEGKPELDPEDVVEVWRRYGASLVRRGEFESGLEALRIALALNPDCIETRFDAGTASFRMGDLAAARSHYEFAALHVPSDSRFPAGLAAIAMREGRVADAAVLSRNAVRLDPGSVTARTVLARIDLHDGRLQETIGRVDALLSDAAVDEPSRIALHDLRAEARDRLDDQAGAFADYAARNALIARLEAPAEHQPAASRIRDLGQRVESIGAARWRQTAGPDAIGDALVRRHVFLLGFPRSGTTLLERIIGSHSAVVTSEENGSLPQIGDTYIWSGQLEHLANLGAAEAQTLRQRYWDDVRADVGPALKGQVYVDKLPLNTIYWPVLRKLFPDAIILFGMRDPRDVVLSCFRRRFRMNWMMRELLTLDSAAALYDAVMAFHRTCRMVMPHPVHVVKHESVVSDFNRTIGDVLDVIGLRWEDGMASFADPSARRTARLTPSDLQITGGLNAGFLGAWKRYEDQLRPVLPVLAPWVEAFGYAERA